MINREIRKFYAKNEINFFGLRKFQSDILNFQI
jgi:hypothetical protein